MTEEFRTLPINHRSTEDKLEVWQIALLFCEIASSVLMTVLCYLLLDLNYKSIAFLGFELDLLKEYRFLRLSMRVIVPNQY